MNRLIIYLKSETSIAPLVTLRILFGFIMSVSVVRFLAMGWADDLYIKPKFFFSYFGFEWLPVPGETIYIVLALMLLSAVGIMLGFFYRFFAVAFFLIFTYVELLDKTNYLNHYYFVSLVSFLLIWVPANRAFSIDAWRNLSIRREVVPAWVIAVFQLQLAIVYIYAGIAKINGPWLLDAMPLKIWLPANNHLPLIGGWLAEPWVAYAFSWAGAAYDLFIVFFLINARTRVYAYGLVVMFHLVTWVLFPIGMFPFIMILCTLVFFSDTFHARMLAAGARVLRLKDLAVTNYSRWELPRPFYWTLIAFFCIQIALPWRYVFYPGKLFWTEQGYRFSWRVMLMEKSGYVIFHVKDRETGKEGDVMPEDFLTPVQVKMMSTQPDMILQFAHFLERHFAQQGIRDVEVRAESYVTLNGSGSQPFIDPSVDLTTISEGFAHKSWILDAKQL